MPEQSPQYGFHDTSVRNPWAQAIGPMVDALNDPRTQAQLAPGMALIKGVLSAPAAAQAALGFMKRGNQPHAYLPPGREIQEVFVPKGGASLHSGESLMRQGKDPGLGYDRTFQTADGMVDYMPPGVRSTDQAARYAQALTGKHTPDPYGPTDDGLFGTVKRLWSDERGSWQVGHPAIGEFTAKTIEEARALVQRLRDEAAQMGNYARPYVQELKDIIKDERGSVPIWPHGPSQDSGFYRPLFDGGYRASKGAKHPAVDAEGLMTGHMTESPSSWAKMLHERWNQFKLQHADAMQEGLTPEQALDAMRRMNMLPLGYDETMRLPVDQLRSAHLERMLPLEAEQGLGTFTTGSMLRGYVDQQKKLLNDAFEEAKRKIMGIDKMEPPLE